MTSAAVANEDAAGCLVLFGPPGAAESVAVQLSYHTRLFFILWFHHTGMAYPLSAGLTVRRRASRTGEAGIIRSAGNVPFPECHQLIEDSLFT